MTPNTTVCKKPEPVKHIACRKFQKKRMQQQKRKSSQLVSLSFVSFLDAFTYICTFISCFVPFFIFGLTTQNLNFWRKLLHGIRFDSAEENRTTALVDLSTGTNGVHTDSSGTGDSRESVERT